MIIQNGYKTFTCYDCFIGSIANYLSYFKIPINDMDLFFCGHSFDFIYYGKENNTFSFSVNNQLIPLLHNLGIELKPLYFPRNKKKVKELLIQLIRNEQALILSVETSKITYESIFSRNRSITHYFNLVGYDTTSDKFCISDCFIPDYTPFSKEFWILSEDLLHMIDKDTKLLILSLPSNTTTLTLNTRHSLRKQLEQYVRGNIQNNIYYGKYAIKQFMQDAQIVLLNTYSIDLCKEINFQLWIHGFIMAHKYLYMYLQKNHFNMYSQMIQEIETHWKMLCLLLLKYCLTQNHNKLHETFREIKNICNKEEKLFEELLQII